MWLVVKYTQVSPSSLPLDSFGWPPEAQTTFPAISSPLFSSKSRLKKERSPTNGLLLLLQPPVKLQVALELLGPAFSQNAWLPLRFNPSHVNLPLQPQKNNQSEYYKPSSYTRKTHIYNIKKDFSFTEFSSWK